MKFDIPKENDDIRKAVIRRIIRQLVLCVLCCAIVSVWMIVWGYDYFTNALDANTAIAIWVFLCLLPFLKCKCWRWFDTAYEGQVISCKHTSFHKTKSWWRGKQEDIVQMYAQNIRLRLPNGKEKTVKVIWSADEETPYYYEGDYVRHYRGTKFMQVISDKPEVPRICVMCGTSNRPEDTVCGICRKSLIDHRK